MICVETRFIHSKLIISYIHISVFISIFAINHFVSQSENNNTLRIATLPRRIAQHPLAVNMQNLKFIFS